MLDRLFDFLESCWEYIVPFYVVEPYENAVLTRLGKYKKSLYPGIHFKFPFIDKILCESVVPDTICLDPQSLVTKDNKSIVVAGIIKYELKDIKTFLLDVQSATASISDITMGSIAEVVSNHTYEECKNIVGLLQPKILKQSRREAERWGVKIIKVTIKDLQMVRSIRILMDNCVENIGTL